jgi:SAM-dependent methyltransferase
MFEKNIPFRNLPKELSVAVLGGSKNEPELYLLEKKGFNLKVTLLGIENYDEFVDINFAIENNHLDKYDLILCSQVLEHVWNHDNAFKTFENLLNPEGYLWVSCPASNRYHGSPEYYVAGFHADFFVKKLDSTKLQVMYSGILGTRRNYFATHSLPVWLSSRGHKYPMLFAFENRPLFLKIVLSFRYFLYLLVANMHSPRLTTDPRCATETWFIAKLSEDKFVL